jgi:TPR repeat protein
MNNTPEQNLKIALMYIRNKKYEYALEKLEDVYFFEKVDDKISEKVIDNLYEIFTQALDNSRTNDTLEILKGFEKRPEFLDIVLNKIYNDKSIGKGIFYNRLALECEHVNENELAFEYFLESTKYNISIACNNLANCYYKGRGCKKDWQKALKFYEKAWELDKYQRKKIHYLRMVNCYLKTLNVCDAAMLMNNLSHNSMHEFLEFYKTEKKNAKNKLKKQLETKDKEIEELKLKIKKSID